MSVESAYRSATKQAPEPGERHVAYADGNVSLVLSNGRQLLVEAQGSLGRSRWHLHDTVDLPRLEWHGACSGEPTVTELLAALDAVFQFHPHVEEIELSGFQLPKGMRDIIVAMPSGQRPKVARQVLWQQPRMWLPDHRGPNALQFTLTEGRKHPVRLPKPEGTVYQRFIPWLGKTLRLRTVDPQRDLTTFNRWMNDPMVARFWEEQGDVEQHRVYLERSAADPHSLGLFGCLDDEPFGYFEAYWAKEDRVAPFYDAGDYDRGWHALIGEARYRGRPFLTAWLPSLSHYLFLDDCRTQRIVVEPRFDNQKMRKSLPRCGYDLLKEFDFTHKRAVLGILQRERFYAQALWIPQIDATAPTAMPL